jgi:2'-5' RNA ligase
MPSRSFFALWPDDPTRDRLETISRGLPPATGKLVARENFHITLAFLGSLEPAVVDNLRAGAALIKGRRFAVQLDHLGWWRRPQVLWLGALSTPQPLLELVEAINALQVSLHLRPDTRPYQPHLTIARKVARKPRTAVIAPLEWKISSFCLAQSRTLPAGAEYAVVDSWPLSSD